MPDLTTVRDRTFEVMRRHGMTRIFGNPGSTEIPFLTDLPAEFEFVLALHEGSVVGIASGYALATGAPAFVNLHTAPGLGHAGNAIGGARDSRAPLVIVVGQQDRAHSAMAPFLTGRDLDRLAGSYPVWTCTPTRPQDLPGAIARAWHEARTARGPALVIAPMGDWAEPADADAVGAPERLVLSSSADPAAAAELADLIEDARSPAIVVGAGCDSPEGWAGTIALAERLGCAVWQEAFGDRAGFPQDHPLWAGHLHWRRPLMRASMAQIEAALAPHGFLRTHRSWLVNPARVRGLSATGSGDFRIDLGAGLTAPSSRRYPEAVRRLRGEQGA